MEREALFRHCDRALVAMAEILCVQRMVGVGRFAADRAAVALQGTSARIGVTREIPRNTYSPTCSWVVIFKLLINKDMPEQPHLYLGNSFHAIAVPSPPVPPSPPLGRGV